MLNSIKFRTTLLAVFLYILTSSFAANAARPLSTPDPEDIEWPGDSEPASDEMIELGKMLFFDPRLVPNESQSCATCHDPNLGFADGVALDMNHKGKKAKRNSPSIVNLAFATIIHWDGRSRDLEHQVFKSIKKRGADTTFIPKINKVSWYKERFAKLFPKSGFSKENIATAISAFERSLISNNSPFDQYLKGNSDALSTSAKNGLALFEGKGKCTQCHDGATFTDYSFHNIGLNSDDKGRGAKVDDPSLIGAFKTQGLRNILLTAPYMHDGSIATLEEVIQFYNRGGDKAENRSDLIKPLNLTEQEIWDLVAFLGALTDPVVVIPPKIPR